MIDWVPVALFFVIGVIFGLHFFFRFRTKQEMHQTIREVLARGDQNGHVIEEVMAGLNPPNADLRRGLIAVAIGFGFVVLGIEVGDADAFGVLIGISAFPFCIGLAFIVMWLVQRRTDGEHKDQ